MNHDIVTIGASAGGVEEKARTHMQQADYIRELVLHGIRLDRADASKI